MRRSSETIGSIATTLAKAQAELSNPEKTLTATIPDRSGERTFRYASLASGLDLVRKCLGQHEIAVMQTTAVDQGQITLTTLLVHASGEWVSSLWPVCQAGEPSASQVKGAALTYARRYALFTLVGIAGEDDLDAPDLLADPQPQSSPETAKPQPRAKANLHSPRPATLDADKSAELRNRLLLELSTYETDDALAVWAYRSLPLKNTLTKEDAEAIEAAYLSKVGSLDRSSLPEAQTSFFGQEQKGDISSPADGDDFVAPIERPVRKRSKAHLAFVASQRCLICKTAPCDAHHLKIARPRSLGRKVSDEFTVPLCRKHHQELHGHGNEASWWANMQVAPLSIEGAVGDEPDPRHTKHPRGFWSGQHLGLRRDRNVNVDQAHTGTVPSIPAELEQLAPPPLLLSGKSIQRYHLMRRAVLLELAPRSAIDWILATDVGRMVPDSARQVVERMRAACFEGVRLVSDRQPTRLRVDQHTSGNPAIWLQADETDLGWIIVDTGERDWSKLAYQFGHEFGHVTVNSWRFDARPGGPCQRRSRRAA